MKTLNLVLFSSILLTAGCASNFTPTVDPRTPEQKSIDFSSAGTLLTGRYEVKDARVDEVNAKEVVIAFKNGSLSVLVKGNDVPLLFQGVQCMGRAQPSPRIYCPNTENGISAISMEKASYDRTVKSGALLGGFTPMDVKSGDYVFEYTERMRGRSHYYLLRRLDDQGAQR